MLPCYHEHSLSCHVEIMSIEKFTREKVLSVHRWTNTLFSFTMTRPAHFKFTAGQFARIGLQVGETGGSCLFGSVLSF